MLNKTPAIIKMMFRFAGDLYDVAKMTRYAVDVDTTRILVTNYHVINYGMFSAE